MCGFPLLSFVNRVGTPNPYFKRKVNGNVFACEIIEYRCRCRQRPVRCPSGRVVRPVYRRPSSDVPEGEGAGSAWTMRGFTRFRHPFAVTTMLSTPLPPPLTHRPIKAHVVSLLEEFMRYFRHFTLPPYRSTPGSCPAADFLWLDPLFY